MAIDGRGSGSLVLWFSGPLVSGLAHLWPSGLWPCPSLFSSREGERGRGLSSLSSLSLSTLHLHLLLLIVIHSIHPHIYILYRPVHCFRARGRCVLPGAVGRLPRQVPARPGAQGWAGSAAQVPRGFKLGDFGGFDGREGVVDGRGPGPDDPHRQGHGRRGHRRRHVLDGAHRHGRSEGVERCCARRLGRVYTVRRVLVRDVLAITLEFCSVCVCVCVCVP